MFFTLICNISSKLQWNVSLHLANSPGVFSWCLIFTDRNNTPPHVLYIMFEIRWRLGIGDAEPLSNCLTEVIHYRLVNMGPSLVNLQSSENPFGALSKLSETSPTESIGAYRHCIIVYLLPQVLPRGLLSLLGISLFSKYLLNDISHVNIWQVSSPLDDTRQIWTWVCLFCFFSTSVLTLVKIQKITERKKLV